MKYVNFSENFQVKMTSIPPPPCETIPLGVNHVLYEQLKVGILRDRELEFVTIQKLWLPLKPRINEFRWDLKSTYLGKPSWKVNLKRWCPFWFCFNIYEFWDPNSKKPLRQLHTDETLSDLLLEHMKAPRRVFFFVEELKAQQQWKPKVSYKHQHLETNNADENISENNFDKKRDEEKMLTLSSCDHKKYPKWDEMSIVRQRCMTSCPYICPLHYPLLVPVYIPVYILENTQAFEHVTSVEPYGNN
ncbi:hypothetical protein GAYE_HTGSCF06PCTG21G0271 [Galdieria yellowstonensis]|uniref:Uncharacterized protein n=1 Tax=Galdieria yellowstonensis TaxID=3028027 RepID=A0AAV9I5J3_9RHOD|nr:hypothetical protein GAYE_HTGSCF06PCTG21G0271 [Galdieria yellowstonensis]